MDVNTWFHERHFWAFILYERRLTVIMADHALIEDLFLIHLKIN